MTSHVRHRRSASLPAQIEPGELHVDPPARQLTAGDVGGAAGAPMQLLAVRFFDQRSSYALHDYAVQDGSLYRSLSAIPPGPFVATQWEVVWGGGGGTAIITTTPVTIPATVTEVLFNASGPVSATLPSAAAWKALNPSDELLLKDISGQAGAAGRQITNTPAGADTIDGLPAIVINGNYGFYRLKVNGTNWMIV
jgi:hypothetical protein